MVLTKTTDDGEDAVRIINVLWTSGWDSTYRVLDACATRGLAVQPHYIIDRGRSSHAMEVLTICLLTQEIAARYPGVRIARPILTEMKAIPADPDITQAYQRLSEVNGLGEQYDWLPRYMVARGILDMELCVHQQDRAHRFIAPLARRDEVDGDSFYAVPPGDDDATLIFSKFRYPVLEMTKVEMQEEARRKGFLDIMEHTWFCHTPTPTGEPCGVCNPCIYTAEEGLARRLPAASLRRQKYRRPIMNLRRRMKATARRTALWLGVA
ncbi:7-cyano-7-deazaguanine synthase [Inquilinus limosus]|uniref:hypothetical protein n=1 Tax=Inquilinus limosus TaxID=171674 RepID=UPI003F1699F2